MNKNLDHFICKSPYRHMTQISKFPNLSLIERLINSNRPVKRTVGHILAFMHFARHALVCIAIFNIIALILYKRIRFVYPNMDTIEVVGKAAALSFGMTFFIITILRFLYWVISSWIKDIRKGFRSHLGEIHQSINKKVNTSSSEDL